MKEKEELMCYLHSYPALYLFIKSIDNGTVKLPNMFSIFITSLAFNSPVCGYIHPSEEVEKLIQSLVKGVDVKCDPVMWQSLHNNIPVLFTLLENSCRSSAPAELRLLLDELWELAMLPFDNCDIINDSSFAVEEAEISLFHSLSTCRPRGHYGMDEKKSDNSCQKSTKVIHLCFQEYLQFTIHMVWFGELAFLLNPPPRWGVYSVHGVCPSVISAIHIS
jgi:hypothetical protein